MEKRLGKAPVDSEGYVQSFGVEETEKYIEFFNEYGFVVINNVLSSSQCQATVDEVWRDVMKSPSFEEPINRDDPSTWGNDRWPQQQRLGILGSFPCVGPQALANRQNPLVYKVFSSLLNSQNLLATFDRYGILRPAKEHPEWQTMRDWVHWDLNPWSFRSSTIYFSPKAPAPGKKYNKRRKDANFVPVPKGEKLFYDNLQAIPMKAGSLIVWNSKQPHGNYPNNSDRFRICQYIKMISMEHVEDENLKRDLQGDPQYLVPPTFNISELGEKLFSLKPWPAKRNLYAWSVCIGMVMAIAAVGLYRLLY